MKTVLYVEDNTINVLLVEEIFSSRPNVRLLTALRGQPGLDLAEREHPDLILLDLHLPDMDGATFLQELRARPAVADIPVIILSADALFEQSALQDLGVVAYISKPFDLAEFERLMDIHLGPNT